MFVFNLHAQDPKVWVKHEINFSNNYIGEGKLHKKELIASGIVLEGTSDVCIVGNLFAGVLPEALTLQGKPSKRINFTANVFTDVTSGHKQLTNSVVEDNLEQDLSIKR